MLVEQLLNKQHPETTVLRHAEGTGSAVAVLLRGHAFRGSLHDGQATRLAAQQQLSLIHI